MRHIFTIWYFLYHVRTTAVFTKYPCFLCMRDSRDKAQNFTKDWLVRDELVPCRATSVMINPLVDTGHPPPLHITFVLIKQFTKPQDKAGG